MSRQDDIAAKAVRKSTLKSIKSKKKARIKQLKENYDNELREIEIQYAENPERLKAKFAADDYAKTEKAKKRAEKKIAREKKEFETIKDLRPFTPGEEISSSIIQGIGAALFIAATAVLDTVAIQRLNGFVATKIVSYSLFGASMILMYLFSVLSHSLRNIRAKDVFQRLSHSFSFAAMGFVYTIYSITKIQGVAGWVLFGIVIALSVTGIAIYAVFSSRVRKINIILYAVTGFSGMILCKSLYHALPTQSFTMLLTAAGVYLLGIILYSLRQVKYLHFVSNIVLLAANIFMAFSLFYID